MLFEDDAAFDEAARLVFYELDIIKYPAVVLSSIKNPSLETLRELVLCVHQWLSAFERYCRSRPIVLVAKKGTTATSHHLHIGSDSDDEQQAAMEREFDFGLLLAVHIDGRVICFRSFRMKPSWIIMFPCWKSGRKMRCL